MALGTVLSLPARAARQVAGLAAALLLSTACAGAPPSAPVADSASRLDVLIGDAMCESDAQCRTVGIGSKACGGPRAYRAWSSLRTDAGTLQPAAEQEARRSRAAATASGILSNCAVVADPGAHCAPVTSAATAGSVLRQCRLGPRGSGGAMSAD